MELFLLFSPTCTSIQQATVELLHFLLFLSTPSSHPSLQPHSLPLLSFSSLPPLEKSSSRIFSLKRAGNWILAGLQFPGLRLLGGGSKEDRTGEGRQERNWRAKTEGGGRKVLCGTFFKPTLTTAPTEDGLRNVL